MFARYGFSMSILVFTLVLSLDAPPSMRAQQNGNQQGQQGQKKPKLPPEDDRILQTIDKAVQKLETERDRLIKDIKKVKVAVPQSTQPAGQGNEFDQWFDRLANGAEVWRREDIAQKPMLVFFDRMADRLQLADDQVTRQQFRGYAEQFLSPGSSPPLKQPKPLDPAADAAKLFRTLDRDKDGILGWDEMPEFLRVELGFWDTNGDGCIDLDEYVAYYESRLSRALRDAFGLPDELNPRFDWTDPGANIDPPRVVYRPGNLPAYFPTWFSQLDTDNDGQVGFYEWKANGGLFVEFMLYDLNGDGFITADEMVRVLAKQRR